MEPKGGIIELIKRKRVGGIYMSGERREGGEGKRGKRKERGIIFTRREKVGVR